ncbi:MAG: glycosyltransferase family 2 protein [Desulfurococcales archaeon]|nr:glycosyltransferase family 2 protein [Desulfurococcales archaeon]
MGAGSGQSEAEPAFPLYDLSVRAGFRPRRWAYVLVLALAVAAGLALPPLLGVWPHTSLRFGFAALVVFEVLKGFWILYTPFLVIIIYGITSCLGRCFTAVPDVKPLKGVKVVFEVTSRGFNHSAIASSVASAVYWGGKYIEDFEVWLVVEEDARSGFFEELSRKHGRRLRVLYVPKTYVTARKTLYKARALNYAVQVRLREGLATDKVWVFLMDEESVVGEDTVVGIVDFIERSSETGKFIGQGLVAYANKWGAATIASAGEGLRPVWELGTECAALKLFGKKFCWKGSNLLVRADVEASITWDFGVLGDDLAFGLIAQEKNRFGWLWGLLYEQSPFTLKDSIRQKVRWYENLLDIMLKLKEANLFWRSMVLLELLVWHASIFGFFLWLLPSPLSPYYLTLLLGTLVNAAYGVYFNSYFAGTARKDAALKFIATPIALAVIAVAPWIGLVKYVKDIRSKKEHGFYVVKK